NAIGAPAQSQFAQIACPKNQRAAMVCQPKKVRCAFTRLYILECHVVDRFARAKRVPKILEHLDAARPDVDFLPADAKGLHQSVRVLQRLSAGGESRHRIAEDVFPRQFEAINGFGGYDESMRRI